MLGSTSFSTYSPEETEVIGKQIGRSLQPGDVIFLTGDLGSGKTTFVKGVIQSLTETAAEDITSPTFSYLHQYGGATPVYHFDLYRLHSSEEFLAAGFHELVSRNAIYCFEWPDRLPPNLIENPLQIHITYVSPQERHITIENKNVP